MVSPFLSTPGYPFVCKNCRRPIKLASDMGVLFYEHKEDVARGAKIVSGLYCYPTGTEVGEASAASILALQTRLLEVMTDLLRCQVSKLTEEDREKLKQRIRNGEFNV